MEELIAELPAQLRWAGALTPPEIPSAEEALVIGMGGSGIAGTIASLVAEAAGRRVSVHKDYGLPGWAGRHRPLVVAVSHSGNTEETLTGIAAARDLGLMGAVLAGGGRLGEQAAALGWAWLEVPPCPQPRAAIGHLAGGTLRLLESAGILPDQRGDLWEAADVVEQLLDGSGAALAADLAEGLDRRIAVVVGGRGVAEVAAQRWKAQINENGKAAAFWSTLPEADHNEIEGWTAWPRLFRDHIGIVWLRDGGDHPRVALRSRLTDELIRSTTGIAGEVWSSGESALARLFSLVVIGDLVSVAVAERAGIDPMPVEVIAELKLRLAQEET